MPAPAGGPRVGRGQSAGRAGRTVGEGLFEEYIGRFRSELEEESSMFWVADFDQVLRAKAAERHARAADRLKAQEEAEKAPVNLMLVGFRRDLDDMIAEVDKWVKQCRDHPSFGHCFRENARDVLNKQNDEQVKKTLDQTLTVASTTYYNQNKEPI